jgi:DNA-binding SARP family transcriptional activator
MGILKVVLFGSVRISHNDWLSEVIITREIQALLAFLILQPHRTYSREVLADVFWGEQSQEKARGSLNTALWKLRKALEPDGISPGTYLKTTHSGEVGFNKDSPYWLDVEVFEGGINQILAYSFQSVEESHVVNLKGVLELYSGELLERFYDTWVLSERERLNTLYLKGLIYLMQYYGFQRNYDDAITYAKQILKLDPLREEIHREMMRLYLANGQRTLALRQYEICRSLLAEEFGIAPMEDTQALYAQIFSKGDRGRSTVSASEQNSIDQALLQLREASKAIDIAKEQIQQALHLIAKFSKSESDE